MTTTTLAPAGNPSRWRILALVLARHAEGRPVTIRWLAGEMGHAIFSVVGHLHRLRRDGLLSWETGQRATIVPTCMVLTAEQLLGPAAAGESEVQNNGHV